MTRAAQIAFVFILLLTAAAGGLVWYGWRPAFDPIAPPDRAAFDERVIARGRELAAIGNCNVCHTAAGGRAFAGGRAIQTSFGTIYSTNITPDGETGIGTWSEAAFIRSMRDGVGRDGRHLYPAFPYDHFTRVTDEDNRALYAYVMTRAPVRVMTPRNELYFPLDLRIVLAAWKLLFFRPGPVARDPARGADWNHGAYLVEGLAHCGACHTPRNLFGAEIADRSLAGGEADGWFAYALDESSPAPVPWDAPALHAYLRRGWHELHGIARGPMAPVATNLGTVPDADVAAIAIYVASRMREPGPERAAQGRAARERARAVAGVEPTASGSFGGVPGPSDESRQGEAIYVAACATCHESGRPLPLGALELRLSTAIQGTTAINVIDVVLHGLSPAEGEASAIMPGFAGAISNEQLANLLGFLRERFSDKPPWTDIGQDIREVRARRRASRSPPVASAAPADPNTGTAPW